MWLNFKYKYVLVYSIYFVWYIFGDRASSKVRNHFIPLPIILWILLIICYIGTFFYLFYIEVEFDNWEILYLYYVWSVVKQMEW